MVGYGFFRGMEGGGRLGCREGGGGGGWKSYWFILIFFFFGSVCLQMVKWLYWKIVSTRSYLLYQFIR